MEPTQTQLILKWQEALNSIKEKVAAVSFDLWFKTMKPVGFSENKELILIANSSFAINQINKNYSDILKKSLQQVFGEGQQYVLLHSEEQKAREFLNANNNENKTNFNNVSKIEYLKPIKEKINSHFSQRSAIKYDLSSQDLIIFEWLLDFISSGKMDCLSERDEDNNIIWFHWVNYKKILSDLPLLKIKESRIKQLFQKYENNGLIKRKLIKNRQFVYVNWHLILYDKEYYEKFVKPYLEISNAKVSI